MDEGGMMKVLGDGWLGSLLTGILVLALGGLGGWLMRRPIEKAGILEAVNKRLETYMAHLERRLTEVTDQHAACQERLDAAEGRADQLQGEVRQLRTLLDSQSHQGEFRL